MEYEKLDPMTAAGLQDWVKQLQKKTRTASEIIYGS